MKKSILFFCLFLLISSGLIYLFLLRSPVLTQALAQMTQTRQEVIQQLYGTVVEIHFVFPLILILIISFINRFSEIKKKNLKLLIFYLVILITIFSNLSNSLAIFIFSILACTTASIFAGGLMPVSELTIKRRRTIKLITIFSILCSGCYVGISIGGFVRRILNPEIKMVIIYSLTFLTFCVISFTLAQLAVMTKFWFETGKLIAAQRKEIC